MTFNFYDFNSHSSSDYKYWNVWLTRVVGFCLPPVTLIIQAIVIKTTKQL